MNALRSNSILFYLWEVLVSLESKVAVAYGLVLVGGAVVIAFFFDFQEVRFVEASLENIGALLLTLAIVATVIERAVEVYVARRYDAEKIRLGRPLARAQANAAKAEKLLAEERERREGSSNQVERERDEHMLKLLEAVENAQKKVEEIDEQTWLPLSKFRTRKLFAANILALSFGALASFAGVRVLGQFLPMGADGQLIGFMATSAAAVQLEIFRAVDTILTALVLAGGADGIHKMISSFKSFRSSV